MNERIYKSFLEEIEKIGRSIVERSPSPTSADIENITRSPSQIASAIKSSKQANPTPSPAPAWKGQIPAPSPTPIPKSLLKQRGRVKEILNRDYPVSQKSLSDKNYGTIRRDLQRLVRDGQPDEIKSFLGSYRGQ